MIVSCNTRAISFSAIVESLVRGCDRFLAIGLLLSSLLLRRKCAWISVLILQLVWTLSLRSHRQGDPRTPQKSETTFFVRPIALNLRPFSVRNPVSVLPIAVLLRENEVEFLSFLACGLRIKKLYEFPALVFLFTH